MDNWEFDFSYKAGSTNLRAWEEKQSPWKIFPSLENEHERDVPWELLNYGKCQAKISLLFFGRKEFEMFGKTIDFPVCSLKLSLSTKPTDTLGKILWDWLSQGYFVIWFGGDCGIWSKRPNRSLWYLDQIGIWNSLGGLFQPK